MAKGHIYYTGEKRKNGSNPIITDAMFILQLKITYTFEQEMTSQFKEKRFFTHKAVAYYYYYIFFHSDVIEVQILISRISVIQK